MPLVRPNEDTKAAAKELNTAEPESNRGRSNLKLKESIFFGVPQLSRYIHQS